MLAKIFEKLTGRLHVHEAKPWAGRLASRPEFRRKIESEIPRAKAQCTREMIVFLAGQPSRVLADIASLREVGYEVQVGMEGCLSGAVFVVDPDTFVSRDALDRMLSLIHRNTSEARIVVRSASINETDFRGIVGRHGYCVAPDKTMEDVADILGGNVMFACLSRDANPEVSLFAPRVVA